MNQLNERYKCLASYAVFREMNQDGESDIYGIIASFADEIINSNNLYEFTEEKIQLELKSQYEFDIYVNIIKNALKKLKYIKRENRGYITDFSKRKNNNSILENKKNAEEINEKIVEELYLFIEKERNIKTNKEEKRNIREEFCSFLLDETNGGKYCNDISGYLISNSNDVNFTMQIAKIREGVVLYTGLNYNNNINCLKKWNEKMDIYLENEILFHLAGFNGKVFQTIVKDMLSLIKEVNSHNKRKILTLVYFEETEEIIENYFSTAVDIVNRKRTLEVGAFAMKEIVGTCKNAKDIILKKHQFFSLLKQYDIIKKPMNQAYIDENHKYNIEDTKIINEFDLNGEKHRYVKFLNYINILRKGATTSDFKQAKIILLTEVWTTLSISKKLKSYNQEIPLAINICELTNRLWFDLGKGFGGDEFPKSFGAITKAQIILSKHMSDELVKQYEIAKEKYNKKELDEDSLIGANIEFREKAKKPEEIDPEEVEEIMQILSGDSLEKYIRNHEQLKIDASKNNKQSDCFKEEIKKLKANERDYIKINAENFEQSLNKTEEMLEMLIEQRKRADKEIKFNIITIKAFLIVIILEYFAWVIWLCFKHTPFENVGVYITTALPLIITVIYLICKEKTFNGIKIIEKYKEKCKKRVYKKNLINEDKILELEKEIELRKRNI